MNLGKAKTPDKYPGFIIVPNEDPIRFGSLTVDYQGNKFELRTLYDIVGWIFSVVGNVPIGATRENYFYPLMMIARVFSTKLISNKKAPDVWMVMWFKLKINNRLVTRVILGATLDAPPQIVKEETKDFRKEVLKKAQVLFWRDGVLPPMQVQEPSGIVGQDFGHCAESYPLLFILLVGVLRGTVNSIYSPLKLSHIGLAVTRIDLKFEKAPESSYRFFVFAAILGIATNTKNLYDKSKISITPYKVGD